eukprot:TRINITY_DN4765_c0_g2_i1.p1 TRINITY_DN4765_c0_g2~~TRINITY_DN4765_c0_g2_i1.p1  ORF type:complete len:299 (+),score=40.64 TRINITY_DN4765_c0_g2_i1:482-1378(+)
MEAAERESKRRKDRAATDRITETLKDCTFAPRGSASSPRRSARQFVTDQRRRFNKSQSHLLAIVQEARKEDFKKYKSKPVINNKSKEMMHKKLRERNHHKDALRDDIEYSAKIKNKMQMSEYNGETALKNKNNFKFIVSKYMREYENALLTLNLNPIRNEHISFHTMQKIMAKMGFIGSSNETLGQIFNKIFTRLNPDKSNTVSTQKLMQFIAAVLNIQLKNSPFNPAKIHKEYKQLYLMRKSYYEGNRRSFGSPDKLGSAPRAKTSLAESYKQPLASERASKSPTGAINGNPNYLKE